MIKRAMTVLLLALFSAPAAFAAGDAKNGKAVYTKHCATCHAADGNGKAAVAKMMKATIPPLCAKEVQTLTDAEIAKQIKGGKGKMQPVKGLSEKEIADVIAYVRTFAKK
ncbi:MAG TPA: cytochrome c [Candidatus Acidoferrales bacterium]|nr:cytochrome c [Candidatus Acidoferrales bacterium]